MIKGQEMEKIIAEEIKKLPLFSSFEVMALYKQRVYNRQEGADGQQLQYTSERYKRFRESEGRQVQNIDFELTGQLRNSQKVGIDDQNVTVFGVEASTRDDANINNSELFVALNEKYNGYLNVSEKEKEIVLEKTQQRFKQEIVKKLNELFK